ncbi:MAG TPA: CbiX/SirB N-terminal domain-containing protein [Burkholderiales bacterium]|nr:CbiX/SirB N-terminal domain-containing protein [Burkholderiales bacterium]
MKKRAASAAAKPVRDGLILFAHGSRSPAWRKPFDRLLKDVIKRGGCQAVLAFGEFMPPTLTEAAQKLADGGVKKAVIVPLFLGGGLHVRSDLPRLAAEARAASGLNLRVARAISEDAGVLNAIADYCAAITAPSRSVAKPAAANTAVKTARSLTAVTSARRKPA